VAADGVLDVAAIAGSEVDVSRAIGRVMVAVGTTASVGGAGALIPQ